MFVGVTTPHPCTAAIYKAGPLRPSQAKVFAVISEVGCSAAAAEWFTLCRRCQIFGWMPHPAKEVRFQFIRMASGHVLPMYH